MIEIIFIDIDNTLLDFHKCADKALSICFNKRNIMYRKEMFDTFLKINDKLWSDLEKKLITKDKLHEVRFELVRDSLNLTFDAGEVELEFRKLVSEIAEPVSYAHELLSYLSGKYPIYAVSNASKLQQTKRLNGAGMSKYMKEIFTSEEIGCAKPSPLFFEECIKRIGNPDPSAIMIIGDSLSADICGGINSGLKTCWFNFKNDAAPKDIKPDFIVNELKEITNIL